MKYIKIIINIKIFTPSDCAPRGAVGKAGNSLLITCCTRRLSPTVLNARRAVFFMGDYRRNAAK